MSDVEAFVLHCSGENDMTVLQVASLERFYTSLSVLHRVDHLANLNSHLSYTQKFTTHYTSSLIILPDCAVICNPSSELEVEFGVGNDTLPERGVG